MIISRGIYEESSRMRQAAIVVLLVIGSFCLSLFPQTLLLLLAPDVHAPAVSRAAIVVQDLFLFVLPPLIGVLLLFRRNYMQVFRLKHADVFTISSACFLILALNPLVSLTGAWNEAMQLPPALQGVEEWMRESELLNEQLLNGMLGDERISILLLNLLLIAGLAGVSEELFFRGFLQNLILRWLHGRTARTAEGEAPAPAPESASQGWRMHLAVWITAVLFSAIHLEFYGFLPRLLLGAAMGYLFVYGGLWAAISAHIANNALTILLLPGQPYNRDWAWVEQLDWIDSTGAVSLCVGTAVAALAFFLLRRHALRKESITSDTL